MVLKLDNAGDVVLSSLVVPRVAEALGNASVVYVVREGLGGLLGHIPCVSDVVEVSAGLGHCGRVGADERAGLRGARRSIREAIARHRPDVIIDLRPTPLGNYAAFFARICGARKRVTLDKVRLAEALGLDKGQKWRRHEAETFWQALEEAGLLASTNDLRAALEYWSVEPDRSLVGADRYFVLQPGAVWKFKRWPEAHYAALIGTLAERYPEHSFVLVGSDGERQCCERVMAATPVEASDRTVNLAGKTSIEGLVSIIAGADMVIANDSGVAHIAGAENVMTTVFFGPSSPERFMPLSRRRETVKVFHHRLRCNPCAQHHCVEGEATYCLARISPADVLDHILSVLPVSRGFTLRAAHK